MLEQRWLDEVASTPQDWDQAADQVEAVVERDHRDDERWQHAQAQQETIGELIRDELVVGLLVTCRRS